MAEGANIMKKAIIILILFLSLKAFATVPANETIDQFFTCDGNTTSFLFTIPSYSASDIKVRKIRITTGQTIPLIQDVNYTIYPAGGSYLNGGTVVAFTAPTSSYKLEIYRKIVTSQEKSYASINPSTTESALDKLTREVQDTQGIIEPNYAPSLKHSELVGLDFASSGHTGFEPTVTKGNLASADHTVTVTGGTNSVIGSGVNLSADTGYIDHDLLLHWTSNKHIDHNSVFITPVSPLSGGGNITTTRTISLAGLTNLGTANYVVGVNSAGTGWEYKHIIAGPNMVITNGTGSITFASSGGGGGGGSVTITGYPLTLNGQQVGFNYDTTRLWVNSSHNLDVNFAGITHNSLGGLQGGTTNQYYHLTSAQVSALHPAVTVTAIPLTLNAQALTFNYDTNDFNSIGNKLRLKNSVHTSGNESIDGVKTFTSFLITPNADPATSLQVVNKRYVDTQVSAIPQTVVQVVKSSTTNTFSTVETHTFSDAFLQSQGLEIITQSITCTIGDVLNIEVEAPVGNGAGYPVIGGIFVDSVSGSLVVGSADTRVSNLGGGYIRLSTFYTATSTSHTFKFRVVGNGNTTTVNNCFGGTGKTQICVTEYKS